MTGFRPKPLTNVDPKPNVISRLLLTTHCFASAAVELQRLSIPSQKDGEEDEEVINVVRDEYGKRHLHEESEADWEGFEAFSSGSESDEVCSRFHTWLHHALL